MAKVTASLYFDSYNTSYGLHPEAETISQHLKKIDEQNSKVRKTIEACENEGWYIPGIYEDDHQLMCDVSKTTTNLPELLQAVESLFEREMHYVVVSDYEDKVKHLDPEDDLYAKLKDIKFAPAAVVKEKVPDNVSSYIVVGHMQGIPSLRLDPRGFTHGVDYLNRFLDKLDSNGISVIFFGSSSDLDSNAAQSFIKKLDSWPGKVAWQFTKEPAPHLSWENIKVFSSKDQAQTWLKN